MKNKTYLDIIDPIHDFIRVFGLELKIIDNPIFQRLRRIRQLSSAHFTYPSAQHTRFEHSLGTMHIAGLAGQTLYEKNYLSQNDVEHLRIAALIHDIGHGPFSHLYEEVLQTKNQFSHEQLGEKIILKSELGDLIKKNSFNLKKIAKLSFGKSNVPFMNEILSGPLSADLMDYLPRDGYFTGAEYAKIDYKRLTQSLDVYKKKLALERSSLNSFESMVISRHQMFKAVYFHKTVRAAEILILQSMKLAQEELNFATDNLDEFFQLTDEAVISQLISLSSNRKDLKLAKQFAKDYQDRVLPKCVFEKIVTDEKVLHKIKKKELLSEISKKSHTPEEEIFIDSSITPSISSSPSTKKQQSLFLIQKNYGKREINEILISAIPLVSNLSKVLDMLRIYTLNKNRKKVEIATKSVLAELE